jgi:hypothetical protein
MLSARIALAHCFRDTPFPDINLTPGSLIDRPGNRQPSLEGRYFPAPERNIPLTRDYFRREMPTNILVLACGYIISIYFDIDLNMLTFAATVAPA